MDGPRAGRSVSGFVCLLVLYPKKKGTPGAASALMKCATCCLLCGFVCAALSAGYAAPPKPEWRSGSEKEETKVESAPSRGKEEVLDVRIGTY